jgi:hypothetical protein
MENKVSDEKLQLFAGMETIDAVDKTVKSMASELLALRADAETSQNHNAAVIDPLVMQLRDAGYTGTLSEMIRQACALQEATRWIPVGERLPETGTYVFVVNDKMKQSHVAKRVDDGRFVNVMGNAFEDVTHWMPLPVPPKGGE